MIIKVVVQNNRSNFSKIETREILFEGETFRKWAIIMDSDGYTKMIDFSSGLAIATGYTMSYVIAKGMEQLRAQNDDNFKDLNFRIECSILSGINQPLNI